MRHVSSFPPFNSIECILTCFQPFPGPGIAIRITGEVTPERVEIAQKADHVSLTLSRNSFIDRH
jgi:GMP synthase PP-ATPase subunit